jgi:hypothetical protein
VVTSELPIWHASKAHVRLVDYSDGDGLETIGKEVFVMKRKDCAGRGGKLLFCQLE